VSYTRQQTEDAIQLLAELYPKCFFADTKQRRPLKHNIVADLINDGVELGRELVRNSVDWYESSFGYQHALQAGVKRIDLQGNLGAAVTEQEQRNAAEVPRRAQTGRT
jgi:sRNA-binding protein